jgi:diaminopimelate epimerase
MWEGDLIRLHFGVVERASERFDVEVNGRRFPGRYVRAGVPHFVVPAEPLEQVRVGEWGASLRHHARFAPDGANVDFVARQTAGGVAMRTYERGVEGETLACGSGAIATALWAAAEGASSPVRVRTAGGDDLVVAFDARGPAYDVTLVGPAEVAFEGTWREAGLDGPDAPRGGG